jgi:flagellar hook protein FlgE
MLRSLFSAISGLRANQFMLDVTGNNIANANTAGYKANNVVFQDARGPRRSPAGPPT